MALEKAMAPHSSTLAWKIPWMEEPGGLQSMGSRRVGYDWATTCTFNFHALEKEMATHSSVLAWRIPGTGEPGGLPSMGSQRVRHDWSDFAAAACMAWSFPRAQIVKNLPAVQEMWVPSLVWRDPLEKEMATHPSILAWRIPWTEEPGGYSPWGCRESDTWWVKNNMCSMWDLSSSPGTEPTPPAGESWSLSHWTACDAVWLDSLRNPWTQRCSCDINLGGRCIY